MIGNSIAGFLGNGVAVSASSFESISTVTVGAGGSSSISFTSIPSTYTHLQVRGSYQTQRPSYITDDVYYYFNGDSTGTTYSWHNLVGGFGATPTVAAGGGGNQPKNLLQWNSTTTGIAASVQTACIIDILDYANVNKYKTSRSLHGYDVNANVSYAGTVALSSGNWRNTAAINSVTFTTDSATGFAQYSKFALYGIKGA